MNISSKKLKIIAATLLIAIYPSTISLITVFAENESLALTVDAKASILMEPSTGKVLFETNADDRLAPASVTKIMTMLLIYETIANGNIQWDDIVTISEHAAGMGGSQVFLEPFEKQTVRDLVKCVVIASANDAAVAISEFISGSEESFVDLMNKKAQQLGLNNTNFKNACGLDEDGHYSSARDLAIITREIMNRYPEAFQYTNIWTDTITHKTSRGEEEFGLTNTNKLIKWYNGATGLKTGSTGKALYCLSGTAEKNGLKLISVVLGAPTPNIRFQEVMKMFDYGFANYKTIDGEPSGTHIGTIPVEKGKSSETNVFIKDKISTIVSKTSAGDLMHVVNIFQSLPAPVHAGDKAGEIIYMYNNEEVGRSDIIVSEDIARAEFTDMLRRLVEIWFE